MCACVCVPVCRFTLVQTHTVEFNQVAMANSEGSEVMLNRVMTKDNIGVAVLLEVNKDMFSGGMSHLPSPRSAPPSGTAPRPAFCFLQV